MWYSINLQYTETTNSDFTYKSHKNNNDHLILKNELPLKKFRCINALTIYNIFNPLNTK